MIKSSSHQTSAPQASFDEIVTRILRQRCISRSTQASLMSILLEKSQLSSQDEEQVRRVFEGVSKGRIRVID